MYVKEIISSAVRVTNKHMFATIQEAYNVVSFDSGKKKRQCNAQAKASADPYESKPVVEEFQDGGKMMSQEETPMTYRGKANDYEYYRKQYGIQLPTIEGFQQPSSCASQAPLEYTIPISEEAKQAYSKAMSTTLDEKVPKYTPQVPKARVVDMSKVNGYYDEELEQYLQTKDNKQQPLITQPTPVIDAPPPETHAPQVFEQTKDDAPKTIISDDAWQSFWDIFLYIFAGILIMFLCEQLFKLAMMIGMKRTIVMLEPYLKKS